MRLFAVFVLVFSVWWLVPSGGTARLTRGERRMPGFALVDVAAVSAGLGVAVFMPGLWGVVVGPMVGGLARIGLKRLKATPRDNDDDLARLAPDALECLASCLAAGAPLWTAMTVVAKAFPDPLRTLLATCVARHAMGAPAPSVFEGFLAVPQLRHAGRILIRSSQSGGALSESLLECADRMREDRAAVMEMRARAVGVKAVGPLGLCFLPAFVLLAVVPIVGSMVGGLLP